MDKGSSTVHFERIVPVDPVTAHKIFLEKTWWGGGLPWYLNILPTSVVKPSKDESGAGGIRQVPLFLQEEILTSELGKFIEYTVCRKVWFPVSYHRGRVSFYEAGPGFTRMTWDINVTPHFHGRFVLPAFWLVIDIMVSDFANECKKRSKTRKHYANSGSWLAFLIKMAFGLYVAFMVSRIVRIPHMKPQPPPAEYLTVIGQTRVSTPQINELVSKNTYLVIGGTGFTGSGIVDDLRKRGAKRIKIMGRSLPPSVEHPYSFNKDDLYPIKGIEYVRGDVTDKKVLAEAMKDVNVVFHIAVSTGNPSFGSIRSHEATERINFGGMKNIYEAAKVAKTVTQIIYTSSADVVFTTRDLHGVNETHPYLAYGITDKQYADGELAVGDAYARTKIMAEKFILGQDNKDNIRTVSLRPNGIYGPGEFSNWKKTVDVPFILGGMPMYFDETQKADWTCLSNLVYAHMLAHYKLAVDPNRAGGKAYFITDEVVTNTAAMEIFKNTIEATSGPVIRGLKVPKGILPVAGWAQEVFHDWLLNKLGINIPPFLTYKEALKVTVSHYFDNSRARNDLGYKPIMTTDECKLHTADEFKRRYWGK